MARRGPSIERVLTALFKGLVKPAGSKAKAKRTQAATSDTDAYPIGLAGESNYQSAIAKLRHGDPVQLMFEPDNPFDEGAIAAVDRHGNTIGYLPRDSWARRALVKERKGCTAKVISLRKSNGGHRGVVIEVVLEGDRPQVRRYTPA